MQMRVPNRLQHVSQSVLGFLSEVYFPFFSLDALVKPCKATPSFFRGLNSIGPLKPVVCSSLWCGGGGEGNLAHYSQRNALKVHQLDVWGRGGKQ